jgi:hypothetical protein
VERYCVNFADTFNAGICREFNEDPKNTTIVWRGSADYKNFGTDDLHYIPLILLNLL